MTDSFFHFPLLAAAWLDGRTITLLAVVLGLLLVAYVVGRILQRQTETTINPAVIKKFNSRIRAWWLMCAILIAGFLFGYVSTIVFFFLVSFWALREFITMTPTRRGDHRALFWTFFLFTPLQFLFVGLGRNFHDSAGLLRGLDFYGLYSIMIPVYASLFIPARIALSGDHKRFLERSAKIKTALLICVYSLSFAPALLDLRLFTLQEGEWTAWQGSNAGLLFYFVLIVQLSDVLQFAWGRLLGRRVIAPDINASKTWEGLYAGTATTMVLGSLLWWATPFSFWVSGLMSLVISLMGFAGSMTMSAIKRDRGVEDYGTLVQGHAGVLDRIDSLCFAAPVFFHLTRFFYFVLPNISQG